LRVEGTAELQHLLFSQEVLTMCQSLHKTLCTMLN